MSINTTLAKWDFLAFSMYKWVSKAFVWTCQVTTISCNQIRWYDRVPADGLDLRDSVLRNPCLLRRRPRSLPLQDPASQGWTRGGLSSIFILNTFSLWSGTRGGESWKEETLASVYLGRLDLKYLVLMYHFFSSKAGSLLWCGGLHILWYPPGLTDEMIFVLHSHSSRKTLQERDWSASASHVKVITSKTTMFAFQCL